MISNLLYLQSRLCVSVRYSLLVTTLPIAHLRRPPEARPSRHQANHHLRIHNRLLSSTRTNWSIWVPDCFPRHDNSIHTLSELLYPKTLLDSISLLVHTERETRGLVYNASRIFFPYFSTTHIFIHSTPRSFSSSRYLSFFLIALRHEMTPKANLGSRIPTMTLFQRCIRLCQNLFSPNKRFLVLTSCS